MDINNFIIYSYHMQGKITECWLAETEGIFFLIKRAWLLDADWLSTPALNWFPASNGVWKGKRIASEFDLNTANLNVKENEHATKRSHLEEKQKDFSDEKKYWFAAWKQFEWGRLVSNEALDRTSWPPNWKLS